MKKIFSGKLVFFILLTIYNLSLMTFLSGCCAPTYPKESVEESIVKICKKEYNLDVKIDIIGKTIAIYVPLPDLLDLTFNMTKSAGEKINNVMLSASRVTLSTDAKIDYYCIIAHDIRIPEIQLIAIRYVDDIKRGFLGDISRDEAFKRMVIDFRLNPQAQKERAIKEVFEKMSLDNKWREDVLNDFFRNEPSGLGDIGYWNGKFYIKDIAMPEFLADQIAGRIRMEFKNDKRLSEGYIVKSSKGIYKDDLAKPYFRFEVLAEPKWLKEVDDGQSADIIFRKALSTASNVFHSYMFDKFEYMEVISVRDGRIFRVSRDLLENFRNNKINYDGIINAQGAGEPRKR